MFDIEAEFRKAVGVSTSTQNSTQAQEPLTLEKLKEAHRLVQAAPPAPVQLRTSRHAPALGTVPPKATPRTGDMRQMCDDIGPQKVPIAYVIETPFGTMAITNPVNIKEA